MNNFNIKNILFNTVLCSFSSKNIILILITFLFWTHKSNATANLSLNYKLINSNLNIPNRPVLGLYVFEPIKDKLYYQSWSGYNFYNWGGSDHSVMYSINKRLRLGTGPSYEYNNSNHNISLKVYGEFTLW